MDTGHPETASDAKRTFEIGACLGKGGFGEVYLAVMGRPGGLHTHVALKVLHEGLAPHSQAVERLRDEGRLLALLRHPAIVRVLDLVVLNGRVTLVSEYIEGVDLHGVRGQLPLKAAVEVTGTVADALAVAWRQTGTDGDALGLVHRDVKPANIRLGRHGEVKLLDFGIAKAKVAERDANTSTGLVLGSIPYLSPERLAGEGVGAPGDVYALGATLWEAIAGTRLMADLDVPDQVRLALDGEEYAEFMKNRVDELGVPVGVANLLLDMLDRDPQARPTAHAVSQRCEGLAATLEGAGLRRWARGWSWPEHPQASGPLTGQSLTDGSTGSTLGAGSAPAASPADTLSTRASDLAGDAPKRSTAPFIAAGVGVVVVLGGLLCLGLGGAVAAGQALWGGGSAATASDSTQPEPVDPDEAPQVELDAAPQVEPDVASQAAPDARPALTERAAPVAVSEPERLASTPVRAAPTPTPTPIRTAPPPTPTPTAPAPTPTVSTPPPAAPTTGRIAVKGRLVPEIRQGTARFEVGELPAGRYALWYDFGEGNKQAGTVEVKAGQTVTVQCNPLRYDCSSR